MYINRCYNFRERNVICKEEAKKILMYKGLTTETSVQGVCKSRSDTSNNTAKCNNLEIVHKIPEQSTGKERNQITTKNKHVWHCPHTSESADVKIQNVYHGNVMENSFTLRYIVTTQ